ncbi:T-cell surface glycoprotein CD4 [Gopherus flavomarginatus]|uniref:T-cell surface glycoprotein CD4 n=1 Tax=Gopherus flavomarginatus TaxID=286002 RepID=UPI0021CBE2FF|nr:T-cell surface glycoprotein CD4 [Gopherus flavomarginatus]XP_050823396.1 T-cell surface glycoprotein CD4 [Gopherus flavomarginatus]XP_050823404.1 T-cell surface glycoprotein CD4 [Gopherus flavomarginatus]
MDPFSVMANSILAVFTVTQLGLIPIMAEGETTVFGAVGEQVILPCIDKSQSDGVIWKYNEQVVIQHQARLLRGRTRLINRSELNKQEIAKGNFSLTLSQLEHSDAGKYVCVVGSRTFKEVQLQVFEVTGSPSDYLLQGENLTLSIQGSSSASVTWSNNHKVKVTATQSRELKNGGRTLQMHNLQAEDSGTWMCHITSLSAKLDIPYKVLVIGFHNLNQETLYKAVNSTVSFSYSLSTHLLQIRELEYVGVGLEWKPMIDSKYQEKFKFNVTSKELLLSKQMVNMQVTWKPRNPLEVKLPKVQFEDAGWYQCQLTVSRGRVEKAIHLVVMTVSADPVGPLSKWANMTLLCKLSAPIPSNAQLFWEHVNGTEKKLNKSGYSEVMVKTKTVGLWRCSLKVENNMITSIDYTVVKAAEWNIYVLIPVVVGVSIVLLLLASLFIFIFIAWQQRRRRAEKMAQARRDLIERRICQCQRLLKNDYSDA